MPPKNGPYFFTDPLSELPREDLIKALIKLGENADEALPTSKDRVCDLLRRYDPLLTLSKLAAHCLSVGVSDSGQPVSKESSDKPQQSHVELAQAILLTINPRDLSHTPIPDEQFQEVWDQLVVLNRLFANARYRSLAQITDDGSRFTNMLVEHLRVHTQFVRNWGYLSHVKEILIQLYGPLDISFKQLHGVGVSNIINMFAKMITAIEHSLTDLLNKLSKCYGASTKREMVNLYFESFPNLIGTSDEFFKFVRDNKISRKALMGLMIGHSDLRRVGHHTFNLAQIANYLASDITTAEQIISQYSFSLGELASHNIDHFFLGNPIRYKPVVNLGANRYFCALPQLFFAFSPETIEQLFKGQNEIQEAISKRRADFLEESIARLFTTKMSGATVVQNFKWRLADTIYETDLIIKFDQVIFVVEAKSGKISDVALRGGVDRIKRNLKDLILAPALQADRFAGYLRLIQAGVALPDDVDIQLPFNMANTNWITNLTVTLEDFATVQVNLREFGVSEFLESNTPATLSMALADMKVIFHVIDSSAELVHYLVRRAEIGLSVRFFGDELDMLGFYVSGGFIFGGLERGNDRISLSGMSAPIDQYFFALDNGFIPAKPKRPMTKWFSDMISFLDRRRGPGWTLLSYMLYCVHYGDQIRLEKEFQSIARRLRKQRKPEKDQHVTVLYMPPPWSKMGLAITALLEEEKPIRHERMSNAASHIFAGSEAQICAIIARDIHGNNYPYTTFEISRRDSSI